jgi:hypothetical protein
MTDESPMHELEEEDYHHQHRPGADVFYSIPTLLDFFLMAYSKARLKSNGHKASPHFRSFCIGNADKFLPMWTLL